MFHINRETGEVGKCKAQAGNCPFGGDNEHYTSESAARLAYERSMADSTFVFGGKDAPKPRTFDELRGVIYAEDYVAGREWVRTSLGNRPEYTFARLMGERTRMTDGRIAEWHAKLDEVIDADPEYREIVQKHARRSADDEIYGRAFDLHIPTPLDKAFDKIWAGELSGFSKKKTEQNLDSHRRSLAGLEDGTVTPGKIVGGGYRNPKKVAREWLQSQIRSGERSLATNGRSESVNVANARYAAEKPGGV